MCYNRPVTSPHRARKSDRIRSLPIRVQFIALAGLSMLILLIGFGSFYTRVADVMIARNEAYNAQIFSEVEQNVENTCDVFARLFKTVAYNPLVQQIMLADKPMDRYLIQDTLQPILLKTLAFANGLLDIVIIGNNGMTYAVTGGASFVPGLRDLPSGKSVPSFSSVRSYEDVAGKYAQDCIVVFGDVTSIQERNAYGKPLGRVALIVSTSSIVPHGGVFSGSSSSHYYLLDSARRLITAGHGISEARLPQSLDRLAPLSAGSYRLTIGGDPVLVRVGEVSNLHGLIIGVTPLREILSDVIHVRNMLFIVTFAALSLLSVAFLFVARNILTPVRVLTDFILQVKDSDLRSSLSRVHVPGCRELSEMGREFNAMLGEIRGLTNRLLETNARLYGAQLSKKQSELSMLQSQINPHFLYNTLETMNGMALAAGASHIVQMTRALSHVFKYAVKAADTVALKDELGMLRAYLEIQQLRFGDRFRVEYDIDPRTIDCGIPKMTLQPIVENALSHGLESRSSGGLIRIRSYLEDGETLRIAVSDNGSGFPPEELRRLDDELRSTSVSELVGSEFARPIGIRNVQSRIRLAFGDAFGLALESSPDAGTTVHFRLPAKVMVRV